MDILIELCQNLNDKLNYKDDDWARLEKQLSPQQSKLLDHIIKVYITGDVQVPDSDGFASNEIFNKGPNYPGFRRLKISLFAALTSENLKFNPTHSQYNSFRRAYFTVNKEVASFKQFAGWENRPLTIYLAKKIIKKAQDYDFTNIVL